MGIGRLRVDAGRYADALPVLQRLVALQPAFNEAHYALGTALTRVGRTDEGTRELAEFTRAQAQATERRRRTLAVDVLKQEALVRTSEGDFDRAEAVWKEILALEPNVAADHAELAAVLLRANRLDGAAAAYEKAAALGAGPDVYRQLAAVYARLGRQAESAAARQKFEQALALPANGAAR
jgi:Flp pilus assembly protein TadD